MRRPEQSFNSSKPLSNLKTLCFVNYDFEINMLWSPFLENSSILLWVGTSLMGEFEIALRKHTHTMPIIMPQRRAVFMQYTS